MSESGPVIVERNDAVALIELNRPAVLNAFDRELRCQLRDALQALGNDAAVRAVVLTGASGAFSSGADLKAEPPVAGQTRQQLLEEYGPGLVAIADMPKPVIAAVDGPAVGIGLAYALVCDLRVMGESAYLQAPFNQIGLLPDGGLSWLLPRLLGYAHAFEFVVEAAKLSAAECLALGVANRVVADGSAKAAALAWAHALAARPARAVAATKRALRAALASDYAAAIAAEAELQAPLVDSDDFREGVTAFREKRSPRFTHR